MVINTRSPRVCLVPNVSGVGGMVSFRAKLAKGLAQRGIDVSQDLMDTPYDAILVIGGTRDLIGLWKVRRMGVRIVQRLDGMNWIHRRRKTGWKHFLRAEYGNFILSTIRTRLADHIVYQSGFSRQWWERVYGSMRGTSQVVYNGVDLGRYSPEGPSSIPQDHIRVLIVEGSIGGGYEWGLETAIQMADKLMRSTQQEVELMVVGKATASLQKEWIGQTRVKLNFTGEVSPERIPDIDRSAHLLYAADINAACPNSVIEALACGLPVVAFETGSLGELISTGGGRLVAYGGDPWKLDPPDIGGLAREAEAVWKNQASFRQAARKRAEDAFGLDKMVEGYLKALKL